MDADGPEPDVERGDTVGMGGRFLRLLGSSLNHILNVENRPAPLLWDALGDEVDLVTSE